MAVLTASGITFGNTTSTITDLSPVGTIICCCFDVGTYSPPEYLYCNGQAVSRTGIYAALFARISITFGAGNGSTTFNVPDLRGEFIRYWDNGRGIDSGRNFASVQGSTLGSHNHNFGGQSADHSHGGNTGNVSADHSHNYQRSNDSNRPVQDGGGTCNRGEFGSTTGNFNSDHAHGFATGNVSADHSHGINADGGGESRPRNISVAYFIKF